MSRGKYFSKNSLFSNKPEETKAQDREMLSSEITQAKIGRVFNNFHKTDGKRIAYLEVLSCMSKYFSKFISGEEDLQDFRCLHHQNRFLNTEKTVAIHKKIYEKMEFILNHFENLMAISAPFLQSAKKNTHKNSKEAAQKLLLTIKSQSAKLEIKNAQKLLAAKAAIELSEKILNTDQYFLVADKTLEYSLTHLTFYKDLSSQLSQNITAFLEKFRHFRLLDTMKYAFNIMVLSSETMRIRANYFMLQLDTAEHISNVFKLRQHIIGVQEQACDVLQQLEQKHVPSWPIFREKEYALMFEPKDEDIKYIRARNKYLLGKQHASYLLQVTDTQITYTEKQIVAFKKAALLTENIHLYLIDPQSKIKYIYLEQGIIKHQQILKKQAGSTAHYSVMHLVAKFYARYSYDFTTIEMLAATAPQPQKLNSTTFILQHREDKFIVYYLEDKYAATKIIADSELADIQDQLPTVGEKVKDPILTATIATLCGYTNNLLTGGLITLSDDDVDMMTILLEPHRNDHLRKVAIEQYQTICKLLRQQQLTHDFGSLDIESLRQLVIDPNPSYLQNKYTKILFNINGLLYQLGLLHNLIHNFHASESNRKNANIIKLVLEYAGLKNDNAAAIQQPLEKTFIDSQQLIANFRLILETFDYTLELLECQDTEEETEFLENHEHLIFLNYRIQYLIFLSQITLYFLHLFTLNFSDLSSATTMRSIKRFQISILGIQQHFLYLLKEPSRYLMYVDSLSAWFKQDNETITTEIQEFLPSNQTNYIYIIDKEQKAGYLCLENRNIERGILKNNPNLTSVIIAITKACPPQNLYYELSVDAIHGIYEASCCEAIKPTRIDYLNLWSYVCNDEFKISDNIDSLVLYNNNMTLGKPTQFQKKIFRWSCEQVLEIQERFLVELESIFLEEYVQSLFTTKNYYDAFISTEKSFKELLSQEQGIEFKYAAKQERKKEIEITMKEKQQEDKWNIRQLKKQGLQDDKKSETKMQTSLTVAPKQLALAATTSTEIARFKATKYINDDFVKALCQQFSTLTDYTQRAVIMMSLGEYYSTAGKILFEKNADQEQRSMNYLETATLLYQRAQGQLELLPPQQLETCEEKKALSITFMSHIQHLQDIVEGYHRKFIRITEELKKLEADRREAKLRLGDRWFLNKTYISEAALHYRQETSKYICQEQALRGHFHVLVDLIKKNHRYALRKFGLNAPLTGITESALETASTQTPSLSVYHEEDTSRALIHSR